jgi:capsular exopolysaccharide synthesis family protein
VKERFQDVDENAAEPGHQRSSRTVFQVVWQRKSLLILGAVLGVVLGGLWYSQRTPVYQSSAQVLVVKKRSDVLPVTGGDPRLSFVEDYLATHMVVIKSPIIVERAVKKRDLQALPSFEATGDPTGVIVGGLTVSRDKEGTGGPSNIINLSFRSSGAEDCGKVLSAVIESYQEFLDITYRNMSDQTLDLITKARDVLKKDLADAEKAYRQLRQTSPVVWKTKDGSNIYQERVAAIESQRSKLLIREAELHERLRMIDKGLREGRPPETLLSALPLTGKAQEGKKTVDEQLLPLLLQEQMLLEDYGADHPQVKSVRRRIGFLRDFVKGKRNREDDAEPMEEEQKDKVPGALDRYVAAARQELLETDMQKQSLSTLLESMKEEVRSLGNYEVEEDHLRGDIMRLQQLHESTIKRLAEINLVRDAGGFDARTLARASAGVKVAPSAFQMLAGGLMLGLLAGVGLAYLAEITDKGFRTPEEVRRRLGLPLVGHIPLLTADADATQKVKDGHQLPDPTLCTYYRPKSLEAESFRAVRTALYFSTQGEGHKVVQVTSPGQGDGKSLVIANLAVSIAQSGKRVILIDADCRRPRQHKIFGLSARDGLAGVIAGTAEARDVIQPTAVERLSLLPCGRVPPNPAELLTSSRFKEFLDAIREQYDFVLVDTPPLLVVTDPCAVAPRVDGVLMVLRLSKQGRPQAERAKCILETLGVKLLGVVINGVTRAAGAGIYSGEHYEYAYTESYNEDGYYGSSDDAYYAEGEADEAAEEENGDGGASEPQGITVGEPSERRPRASAVRKGFRGWLLTWWA